MNITDIRYRRTVETSDNILKKQHSLKDRIKFPMYFKKDNVMTFYTFKHNSTCMAGSTTTMPLSETSLFEMLHWGDSWHAVHIQSVLFAGTANLRTWLQI